MARTSAGIANAGSGQPSFSRAPLISSTPRGEPWHFSVPALLGAPKPMTVRQAISDGRSQACAAAIAFAIAAGDRKSTRLNSSHGYISYAVFCLKKKKKTQGITKTAEMQHM